MMDVKPYIEHSPSSDPTNFDDFIPEVYRIKNSCKGRLIQTKIEEDDYYTDIYSSEPEYPEIKVENPQTLFKGRKHNSRRRTEKPYKCALCSFVTAWKCNIIRHKQQHTREKVFECHMCPYTALQKSNLRTHIRIHLGYKRFNCPSCDYKTMYKSTLEVHLLKHVKRRLKEECESELEVFAHTGEKHFTHNPAKIEVKTELEGSYDEDMLWDLSVGSKAKLNSEHDVDEKELRPPEVNL